MSCSLRRLAGLVQITAIAAASLILSTAASAQVPTSGNVFFGYSYLSTTPLFDSTKRANLNGWEGSLEGKVLPLLGLVVDFSGHYGTQNFSVVCAAMQCPGNPNFNEQNILFGPRVSVSMGKVRPFAQALFGASHIGSDNAGSDTSFATALGGGLDYKIIKPVAWRFQGDYVQTRLFGATQNNIRISTGIVFRF